VNILDRIKYEAIKLIVIAKLRKYGIPMASPVIQTLIAGITQLLATGDSGLMSLPGVSETFDIGGTKYTATESLSVEIKKS
jgi:hypothetical protein